MPRIPLASTIFSHEDQLFSHDKKNTHVSMTHFYQQAMVSKSDWKSNHVGCQIPNKVLPQLQRRQRIWFLSISHIPKNRNNHMFSLLGYADVKVLAHAGWVLPTWKEGYSQVMFSSLLKSNVATYTFLGTMYPEQLNQHVTSSIGQQAKTELKLFYIFKQITT